MSGRSIIMTSRRVPCPTCGVPRFEYCLRDGKMSERSHPDRVEAARLEPSITPAQVEALHKLHVDPTRYMEPIVRLSLLRSGLITSPDGAPGPLPGGGPRQKRRHPLTDAGRAVIGVAVEGEAQVATVSDPPPITAEDIAQVQRESEQLYRAFEARTKGMEHVEGRRRR